MPGQEDLLNEANKLRSENEVLRFREGQEESYFAYLSAASMHTKITTWMGDELARVVWRGQEYTSPAYGMPSKRQNFRALGIDGRLWSGTYFCSSGTYVRMKPMVGYDEDTNVIYAGEEWDE